MMQKNYFQTCFFFFKALFEEKLSGLQFIFNIVFNFAYIKNKLYKVLDY